MSLRTRGGPGTTSGGSPKNCVSGLAGVNDIPFLSKIWITVLTASMMNLPPTHRAWSGGSWLNCVLLYEPVPASRWHGFIQQHTVQPRTTRPSPMCRGQVHHRGCQHSDPDFRQEWDIIDAGQAADTILRASSGGRAGSPAGSQRHRKRPAMLL